MLINEIEFEPLSFNCPNCGAVNDIDYKYLETNKSIQARCKCGKWIGNVKYDKRSNEQIRHDKINQWLKQKNSKSAGVSHYV